MITITATDTAIIATSKIICNILLIHIDKWLNMCYSIDKGRGFSPLVLTAKPVDYINQLIDDYQNSLDSL